MVRNEKLQRLSQGVLIRAEDEEVFLKKEASVTI